MKGRDARRWWALGAITLAVMAAGLDATVLSLALPTLTTALHASESQLQWFALDTPSRSPWRCSPRDFSEIDSAGSG